MKIETRGRRTGKTTLQLTRLRRETNSVLLVHSVMERDRLLMENESWLDSDRVVTVDDVLDRGLRGRYPRPVVNIDNLDLVLSWLLGGLAVGLVTMTEEGEMGLR